MATTDSLPVQGGLALLGVWIHDPLAPQETARQYLYGKASRSASVDVDAGALRYAGRTYPVYDYGEGQDDQLSVSAQVPHGPDWVTQTGELLASAQVRRTLCLRDNRGRRYFGTMSGYSEDDADWGTAVSFSFTRVDYNEGEQVTA